MKQSDTQVGKPGVLYSDTQANIEALTVAEGSEAYATDLHAKGYFNGTVWVWDISGADVLAATLIGMYT